MRLIICIRIFYGAVVLVVIWVIILLVVVIVFPCDFTHSCLLILFSDFSFTIFILFILAMISSFYTPPPNLRHSPLHPPPQPQASIPIKKTYQNRNLNCKQNHNRHNNPNIRTGHKPQNRQHSPQCNNSANTTSIMLHIRSLIPCSPDHNKKYHGNHRYHNTVDKHTQIRDNIDEQVIFDALR